MPEASLGGVGDQVREAVDILEDPHIKETTEYWEESGKLIGQTSTLIDAAIGHLTKMSLSFDTEVPRQAEVAHMAGEIAHAKMAEAAEGSNRESARAMVKSSKIVEGSAAEEKDNAAKVAVEAADIALVLSALKDRVNSLRTPQSAGGWAASLKGEHRPMAIEAGKDFVNEISGG